eukprot:2049115-Lingulodinium_polyedra.AAC.1
MGYATSLALCLRTFCVAFWRAPERLVHDMPPRFILALENWHWQFVLASPGHADLVHVVRLATDGQIIFTQLLALVQIGT